MTEAMQRPELIDADNIVRRIRALENQVSDLTEKLKKREQSEKHDNSSS